MMNTNELWATAFSDHAESFWRCVLAVERRYMSRYNLRTTRRVRR